MNNGKILVVLSSANNIDLKDGKSMPSGFYLNEFGVPAQRLAQAGYELVLANPNGNTPAMDATSDDDSFFSKDKQLHQEIKSFVFGLPGFQAPNTFRDILEAGLDDFAGVFVPGGHAPMQDLICDPQLGQILTHFHQTGKPTAMICHGPAATLSAQLDPVSYLADLKAGRAQKAQGWIYAGYKMTVFSNIEERMAEMKFPAHLQFHIESALQTAGAEMDTALLPMQSKVVHDRELVTGQNPFSDGELSMRLLAMLEARKSAVPSR